MNSKTVAERLKELRVNAGYSHDGLAKVLQEKYKNQGISITSASLKKYEVTDPEHPSYGSVTGMKTQYLYMLADFYGVPSDYILGRTNSISKDITEQAICESMGLSSSAITAIKDIKNQKALPFKEEFEQMQEVRPISAFDYMLSNSDFLKEFIECLINYYYENQFEYSDLSKPNDYVGGLNTDVARYTTIKTVEQFIDNFCKDFQEKQQDKKRVTRQKNQKGAQLNAQTNK